MEAGVECVVSLPFNGSALLKYLCPRLIAGMESVESGVYRRSLGEGELCVDMRAGAATGELRATLTGDGGLSTCRLVTLITGLVDGDAPIARIEAQLGRDPVLGPIVRRHRGLRIPGTVDPFELAVRAILGQQVSVAMAANLAARVVTECGSRFPPRRLPLTFPSPSQLVGAPLERLGISRGRAGAIRELSAQVLAGNLDLSPGSASQDSLEAIRGIGPWTASYISLRGLRDRDAIPVGDLGLRSALGLHSAAEVEARAERWRPWRGYAASYLWTTFLE
jgi:AraC family transcriptional regulator, regulatory protein of adaptative response / DNA-3-methyladenine glycosylase II